MLHAALSGLPLCTRGCTCTLLFGNSFTMLIVDFYSNWYGCQPLLGTQNHPGPKVHTGTRRHIVRNVKGAQLAKASCQVHSSSSYMPLQLFVVNFLRHLVATWMWRQSRTSKKTRKTKKKAPVVRKRLAIRGSSPKCRGKSWRTPPSERSTRSGHQPNFSVLWKNPPWFAWRTPPWGGQCSP